MRQDYAELYETIKIMENFYQWAESDKEVLEIRDDEILALKQSITFLKQLSIYKKYLS